MMHALKIRLRQVEGAALRALGLAERRGFRVVSLTLDPCGPDSQRLSLVVASPNRSVQVLGRQLERLYDVLEVVLDAAADDQPRTVSTPPMAVAVGAR